MGNRTLIHTGFVFGVNALVSYRTEIRIAIRFAANRMGIRSGNRIRVDGPRHLWQQIVWRFVWKIARVESP
jgi:hypothetical protein